MEDKDNAQLPPTTMGSIGLMKNPVPTFLELQEKYPYIVEVKQPFLTYLVPFDPTIIEQVLGNTNDFVPGYFFADPNKPRHSTALTELFHLTEEEGVLYEEECINELKRLVQSKSEELSLRIVKIAKQKYLHDVVFTPNQTIVSLNRVSNLVFWPMTEALLGINFNERKYPELRNHFHVIDINKKKSIMHVKIPGVDESVVAVREIMENELNQNPNQIGPVFSVYLKATHHNKTVSSKVATGAWWGFLGNSIPTSEWMFFYCLREDEIRAKCEKEALALYDSFELLFRNERNNSAGEEEEEKSVFEEMLTRIPYITACFKETLRLTSYSSAWRKAKHDVVVKTKDARVSFLIKKDMLIAPHFVTRHFNQAIFADPLTFHPDRFIHFNHFNIAPKFNSCEFAWVPFRY